MCPRHSDICISNQEQLASGHTDMATASPEARDRFETDLRRFGATAAHSVTDKTSREDERIWRHWSEFTASLGVPETLSSIQHVETRVC